MKICPICQTYLDHIKVLEGLLENKRQEFDKLQVQNESRMNKKTGLSSEARKSKQQRPNHLKLASSQ